MTLSYVTDKAAARSRNSSGQAGEPGNRLERESRAAQKIKERRIDSVKVPGNERRTQDATVLIVDDHQFIRRGMASVLNAQHDIKVVGEAGDGEEAVERAKMLRPNVVIMDLHMPVMDGVEATVRILEELPDTQVIILTTFETDDYILRSLQSGARSYLLKDSPPESLIEAIRAVCRGEAPIEPRIASRLLEHINHPPSDMQGADHLSVREVEVLELAAKGATNKEIGEQLFIAENTIKSHFHRIFDKLCVRDRTHAVAEAARQGIIKL